MTLLETLAALFGFFGVATSTIPHAANWPLNLISSILYMYFFYTIKLYADSSLQIYYIITSIVGWIKWTRGDVMSFRNALPITYLSKKAWVLSLSLTISASVGFGWFFSTHTDASLPYFDASIAALSLLGQWLSTQKKMDSWPIWTIVNTTSVILYSMKAAYITAGLYFIFLIMTIVGWIRWKRIFKIV